MAFMGILHVLAPFFHQMIISEAPPLVANARANQPAMVVPGWQKPWGSFEYTKLPLEQPREFLPDTTQPLGPARWFFANRTRQQVLDLFNSCDLTREQREMLVDPGQWQVVANGVYVSPRSQVVLEMSRAARE